MANQVKPPICACRRPVQASQHYRTHGSSKERHEDQLYRQASQRAHRPAIVSLGAGGLAGNNWSQMSLASCAPRDLTPSALGDASCSCDQMPFALDPSPNAPGQWERLTGNSFLRIPPTGMDSASVPADVIAQRGRNEEGRLYFDNGTLRLSPGRRSRSSGGLHRRECPDVVGGVPGSVGSGPPHAAWAPMSGC